MNSGFLNLNWDQAMDQRSNLDASLSSIVSPQPSNSADSHAFHKLLGFQPHSNYVGASVNSSTELNLSLLGQLNNHSAIGAAAAGPLSLLEQFAADAGFSERAARFSGFDGRNYGQLGIEARGQGLNVGGFRLGMSDSKGMQQEMVSVESANAREERALSDLASGGNARKRKAPAKGKGKDSVGANSGVDALKVEEDEDSDAKRFREDVGTENETTRLKVEQNDGSGSSGSGQKNSKENNSKNTEAPKDYIHVRARRGQATDSHSLAERVRREKISQRMKLLQDLVPGCNKVTGKAVMLDEIINYVQSLQRQVEFLSMKLATVNPRLDFNNLASLLNKDMPQPYGPSSVYPVESSGMASSSYRDQPQQGSSLNSVLNGLETQTPINLLDSTFQQSLNTHQSFCDGFGNSSSNVGNFWEDDLQNVVQMDMGQSQEITVASLSYPDHLPTAHRKIEL